MRDFVIVLGAFFGVYGANMAALYLIVNSDPGYAFMWAVVSLLNFLSAYTNWKQHG